MCRLVGLVKTNVSDKCIASIIKVKKISELGTTLAWLQLLVPANVVPSSPILVTLMTEVLITSKRRFLQEPHGVTSQNMPFFKYKIINQPVNNSTNH
jgi:hypothetical protein